MTECAYCGADCACGHTHCGEHLATKAKLLEAERDLAGFLVKYGEMRHALMDARAYVSCDIFSQESYGPEAAELYERLCLLEANTTLEPSLRAGPARRM